MPPSPPPVSLPNQSPSPSTASSQPQAYSSLKFQLLSQPYPLLPPSPSAPNRSLSHAISSLSLHPSLEAALHILNQDLPSAHFLVRHMQAPPRYEAMMLHAILHRIEGDFENARAWYGDVKGSEVFGEVWSGLEKVNEFVSRVEEAVKGGKQNEKVEMAELRKDSGREILGVIEFCERLFGTARVEDASGIWVQDEKHGQMGNDMIVSRPRRRKFPERELLERLRKYEDLLRQNKIKFDALPQDSVVEKEPPPVAGSHESDDDKGKTERPSTTPSSTTPNLEREYEAKNVWHAMSQEFRDRDNDSDSSDDAFRGVAIKAAWEQTSENHDPLLFASSKLAVNVSILHPDPVQIFRLWQLYLDNVNPLLKVTHTPTLQGRIIEAVSNVSKISPTLEALMFSIYSMSVLSLSEDECQTMFYSTKEDLSTRYQFGCQQALVNCDYLRSEDRDCLTALYLYLVSIRPNTVPYSLCSTLGVAVRIAQRMGIHSESELAKRTVFEAEMCRRLWWAIVLFDARMCELADMKHTTLLPTWDCRTPSNINDSDLRPNMKEFPQASNTTTEAVFAVVRSEVGDYVRNTIFHLDFTVPALKPLVKHTQPNATSEDSELLNLDQTIETKYLQTSNLDNPFHFFTVWTTRAYIAKCHLMDHHFRYSPTQTEQQRTSAISHALSMLQCDTKILTSTQTKGFHWHTENNWPFGGYLHLLQTLKQQPPVVSHEEISTAWQVMSDNFRARDSPAYNVHNPFFRMLAKLVLQAWDASQTTMSEEGEEELPGIVSAIKQRMNQPTPQQQKGMAGSESQQEAPMTMDTNDIFQTMSTQNQNHGGFTGADYDPVTTNMGLFDDGGALGVEFEPPAAGGMPSVGVDDHLVVNKNQAGGDPLSTMNWDWDLALRNDPLGGGGGS